MNILACARIAVRALRANLLRSTLTMLGIIIGVGAVIAMVGLGQGAQNQVQDQIAAMGSNMLFFGSGSVNRGGLRVGFGGTKTLVYEDMQAIVREVPSVAAAARRLGISLNRLNEIVLGKRAITADTALRLSRFFVNSPQFWMGLHSQHNLDIAQDRLGNG